MDGGNESGAPARIRHIPALDGLRGAAVLAVLAFHLGHLQGGYLGVDLFFVLSGFLITSLLLAEGGKRGGIAMARFWGRRARRLLPALGVLLVGVAVYGRFAAEPEALHRIRWDGIATLFYVANWREIFGRADYWAMFTAPSPLAHSWSLAIEEQFYLVWPLVFLGMIAIAKWRRRRRQGHETRLDDDPSDVPLTRDLATVALFTSLTLGTLSLAIQAGLQRRDGWNRVYFGTDTRAFAVLAGAAVAAWISRSGPVRPGRRRTVLEIAGAGGAGVLAVAWLFLDGQSRLVHHGGLPLSSIAGALLIAAIVHPDVGVLSRAFSLAPLRWMGLISYGVYLYHWPLIVWMTPERVHVNGWALSAVQVVATLVVALVSYFIVEQPIRNRSGWTRRMPRQLPRMSYATFGGVVVAVLLIAGTSSRLDPDPGTTAALDAAVATAQQRGGPRIMVVGNSVAEYLANEGFQSLKSDPPLTVLPVTRVGCAEPPAQKFRGDDGTVSDRFGDSCDSGWQRAVDRFRPDLVVFARNGVTADEAWRSDHWVKPCSEEFRHWSRERFAADVRVWSSSGAKVVLVTSLPSIRGTNAKSDPAYLKTVACGNEILRSVAKAHPREVELVDLHAHFCDPHAPCRSQLPGGAPLRSDGTHFRGEGARVVSQWVLSEAGLTVSLPD